MYMGKLNKALIFIFVILFVVVIAEGAYYLAFASKKPILPKSNTDAQPSNTVCVNKDETDFFQSVKNDAVSKADLTTQYKGSVYSITKDPQTGQTMLKVTIDKEKDLKQSFILPDNLLAKIKFLDKNGNNTSKQGIAGLKAGDNVTVSVNMDLKKIVTNPDLTNNDIMSVINSFEIQKD